MGFISRLRERLGSRLVTKLILLFASILLAVVVSLTWISRNILQHETVTNIISSNTNNLMLVNKNIEKYFQSLTQSSFPYASYDNFANAIANEQGDYAQRAYLEAWIKSLITCSHDITSVYLYFPGQDKYYKAAYDSNDLTVRIHYGQNLKALSWYKRLMDSPTNTCLQSFRTTEATGYAISGSDRFVLFHRVFRNITDRKPVAVLSLCLNSTSQRAIFNDIPLSRGEHTILLNTDNRLFYTDFGQQTIEILREKAFLKRIGTEAGQGHFYRSLDKSRFLVIYDVSAADGWKLIKWIPAGQITQNARMNSRISLITGIGFLILSMILVVITSNSITKPLNRLAKKMKAFGRGDFDIQSEISGNDELAQLSKQFNEMVTRINELVNEQYKMKLVQKNAILKALEAELNPHFLYNALQAISTMALKSDAPEVGEMVDALALTLRYCIHDSEIVSVRDEIRHVENYLKIQQARFGSRLKVSFELDAAAMSHEIPKLSIQSLVENSIKHGLEAQSTVSTMVVRVENAAEYARITVKDNGPGIQPERLEEIQSSLEQEWTDGEYQNIGLRNLNTRLKLIFGDRARMSIHSDLGGTTTVILIPERRQADVQGIDY